MAGYAMSSPPPQSVEGSFFVRSGTVSPSRPAKLHRAARSGLDGGEHGAMLPRVGRTSTPPPSTQLLAPGSLGGPEIASPRVKPAGRNDDWREWCNLIGVCSRYGGRLLPNMGRGACA